MKQWLDAKGLYLDDVQLEEVGLQEDVEALGDLHSLGGFVDEEEGLLRHGAHDHWSLGELACIEELPRLIGELLPIDCERQCP